MKSIVTSAKIEKYIYVIRGHAVMSDSDLARLYGVTTKSLNLAVRRNMRRFPGDFMFQITNAEAENLRFQIETSSWGGRRYQPYVFTEQGVAMLSSVLNSPRAIDVNIQIMRAFTRLKGFLVSYADLRKEIRQMKGKYDYQFAKVFDAIDRLLDGPNKKVRVNGFIQRYK